MQGIALQGAYKAMHGEMELRVVVLHSAQKLVNANIGRQFLPNFTPQSIFLALTGLNLPAGEFPPVLPRAITPLGGKNLVPLLDYGCNYFYGFHNANIL